MTATGPSKEQARRMGRENLVRYVQCKKEYERKRQELGRTARLGEQHRQNARRGIRQVLVRSDERYGWGVGWRVDSEVTVAAGCRARQKHH